VEKPIFNDRETARRKLLDKIASQNAGLGDSRYRSTIDPHFLIEDANWRLRWIDCAPEGANHQLAPLQDKQGVPCGGCWNENVGPNQSLRNARAARNLNPFGGNR
jgi:hypothetical protein